MISARVFCDFDGTISLTDIGYDLFASYGSQDPWIDQLLSKEISIYEYWRRLAESLRRPLTDDLLNEYLSGIEIDPGFKDLVSALDRLETPLTIVSDGLDLYVHRVLEQNGLDHLEVICNSGTRAEDDSLRIDFPHAAEECSCPSAVCKRRVVLQLSDPEERLIYIGDGLSDFCPAEHCVVVFAKSDLAAYCNRNGIPHHSWKRFSEVVPVIEKLLTGKRLKKRHQAELKRHAAWKQG